MFNWRKPLISGLFLIRGKKILLYQKKIAKFDKLPPEELYRIQQEKLKKLLLHAHSNVPFYNKLLTAQNVVTNGRVNLDNFKNIPPLTKAIIMKNRKDLLSKDHKKRKTYKNSTAGSTGEKLQVIQDKFYSEWSRAYKFYNKAFTGYRIGEKQILFWGSAEDILKGKTDLYKRIKDWLYNQKLLNTFNMPEEAMYHFVYQINRFKPTLIVAYAESFYEFARFIKKNNLEIHSPRGIITSAGTLFPYMKTLIREVFQCPVLNRYGSREAGDMACSCLEDEGLHLNMLNHYIEILDKNLKLAKPGECGRIFVTSLVNFSMPMIRYDIGDIAVRSEKKYCPCGRPSSIIQNVSGRVTSLFKTRDGKLIDGSYIRFVIYLADWIEKFQIIQKDYEHIIIKLVVNDTYEEEKCSRDLKRYEQEIKILFGDRCQIIWEFVESIEPLRSGKYLYTLSEVSDFF